MDAGHALLARRILQRGPYVALTELAGVVYQSSATRMSRYRRVAIIALPPRTP